MAAPDTLPRVGLDKYRESLCLELPTLVAGTVNIIGRKLTAYIAGVKDVRAVDRWIEGKEPYGEAEARLRFTYQVVSTLSEFDPPRVVQAWLIGVNPELGDRVPLRLLREGDLDTIAPEVLGAVRAFIAGG